MKRKAVTIQALLCAAALSACGSRTGKDVTPPDGKLDGCTLRFSWWGGDDRHEATLNALELWETLHPDIVIDVKGVTLAISVTSRLIRAFVMGSMA